MRAACLALTFSLLVACGAPSTVDGGVDGGSYTPKESRLLGLNDITLLLPLQSVDAGSPFPSPERLVPRALYDLLSTVPADVLTDLGRLRVVAVRFDLCDRAGPEACPAGADGSLRLVLQPLRTNGEAEDIALHTFYPVPRAEVPEVVDAFRALARLQDVPRGSALRVNAAFTQNPAFRDALAALLTRYCDGSRLLRMTLFGQLTQHAALIWVFRGVELKDGRFVRIDIPDVQALDQEVTLFSGDSYQVKPVADAPPGFVRSLIDFNFRAGTPAQQREALEGLAAIDNPTLHTAGTVQCVSCHVTTTILGNRAADAGVDLSTVSTRYTSSLFDLTPMGDPLRFRTLRALGYFFRTPLVAQRTVNETANVLGELEARYPAAP